MGAAAFAVLCFWPTLAQGLWDRYVHSLPSEKWIESLGWAESANSINVANLLLYPANDLAGYAPGVVAVGGVRSAIALSGSAGLTARSARTFGAATVATLIVAGVTQVLFGLPTGYIASREFVMNTPMWTRLADTAQGSLWAGFAEEYYFRGLVYSAALARSNERGALIWSSVAFASCHPLELVPWAAVMGLLFGLLRQRTGSYVPGVGVHIVWNAVAHADAWMLI